MALTNREKQTQYRRRARAAKTMSASLQGSLGETIRRLEETLVALEDRRDLSSVECAWIAEQRTWIANTWAGIDLLNQETHSYYDPKAPR